MARINSVKAGVTSGYTVSNGFNLKISSDADKQVINALKKEMDAQMNELKENIRAEVSKYIQEASQKALGEFGSIEDIKTELNKWLNVTKNYENILNNKTLSSILPKVKHSLIVSYKYLLKCFI